MAGAAHVVGLVDVGRHVVTRQVGVVGTDLLLAGLSDADAQLEGRDGTRILQEILLGDVPRKGARREEAPAGILRETRRGVVAQREGEEVFRGDRIVQASVEREQVVLLAVERVARILALLLVRLVEIGYRVVGAVEMLPRITGHHVEVVDAPLLIEVGVEFEQLVAAEVRRPRILSPAAGLGVGVCLERAGVHAVVGLGARYVEAEVEVEAQRLEAVNLIVDLGVADETLGTRRIVAVVELRERARTQQGVGREVLAAARSVVPVSVGGRVVDRAVVVAEVGVDRGVEEGSRTHHAARSVALRRDDALGVEVDREVLVEEVGREAQVERPAFVFRRFERTLLVGVAHRCTVGHAVVDVADQADVVVMRNGGAEDQILPVGVLVAEHRLYLVARGRTCGIHLVDVGAELAGGHHGQLVGVGLDAHAAAVRYAGRVAAPLLGGDEDDAVRSTRTVDGRRRSVLEHGEGFDVVGVDRLQRVGHTLAAVDCDGYPVDHDQRVVRGVERSRTAHADGGARSGASVAGDDMHARNLTLEHVLCGDHGAAVELFGLDRHDRTGHVVLLDRTVADHHHVVDTHGILFEREVRQQRRTGHQADGLVTDIADLDDRLGAGGADGIVAVDARRDTVGRALFDDGSAQDRHPGLVDNYAFYLITSVLRQREGGGKLTYEQDTRTHS